MLAVDDVTLILAETGETVKHGHLGRQTTKLKSYDVVAKNGAIIGAVFLGMATFERKTAGRMYVNARWRSPRWFYRAGPGFGHRSVDYDTRKGALHSLLWHINSREQSAA